MNESQEKAFVNAVKRDVKTVTGIVLELNAITKSLGEGLQQVQEALIKTGVLSKEEVEKLNKKGLAELISVKDRIKAAEDKLNKEEKK